MGRLSNAEKDRRKLIREEKAKPVRLWIDDLRDPPSADWLWVKTSREAMKALVDANVVEVSFDHDLGGDDTAMPAAKWIEEMAYLNINRPVRWHVHSANPVGRQNIFCTLLRAERFWREHGHKVYWYD